MFSRQSPTAPAPSSHRRLAAVYVLCASLGIVVLLATALLSGSIPGVAGLKSPTATVRAPTATPVRLQLTLTTHLTGIVMRSPTEGWAVGYEGADTSAPPLLLHLLRGAWQREALPASGFAPESIAMTSATEAWIAGDDQHGYDGHGMMLHGIGGRWEPVTLPPGVGPIQSLDMISSTVGWALSAPNTSGHPQILRYAHGAWTTEALLPDSAFLSGLAMVSITEGWAAGHDAASNAVWHYSQGAWQRVPLDDPQGADLEYVSMLSPDEGWGIGSYPLPHQPTDQYARQGGAIWHYAAGSWRVVERYDDDPGQEVYLSAIQAVAPDDVWIAEGDGTGKRFLHLANSQWHKVSAPIGDGIASIAMTSPAEGWAVGAAGQILHYIHGTWSEYPTN